MRLQPNAHHQVSPFLTNGLDTIGLGELRMWWHVGWRNEDLGSVKNKTKCPDESGARWSPRVQKFGLEARSLARILPESWCEPRLRALRGCNFGLTIDCAFDRLLQHRLRLRPCQSLLQIVVEPARQIHYHHTWIRSGNFARCNLKRIWKRDGILQSASASVYIHSAFNSIWWCRCVSTTRFVALQLFVGGLN